jgi:capsular polysaccharide biosynthesis protein
VANEAALVDFLAEAGFVNVFLEELDVGEQIRLFRGAEIIVGAHGAGLTNILFCRPGTKLLELFPTGGLHASSFIRMASLLGLEYAFFCGAAVRNVRSKRNPRSADIDCDMTEFRPFFRDLLDRWT